MHIVPLSQTDAVWPIECGVQWSLFVKSSMATNDGRGAA